MIFLTLFFSELFSFHRNFCYVKNGGKHHINLMGFKVSSASPVLTVRPAPPLHHPLSQSSQQPTCLEILFNYYWHLLWDPVQRSLTHELPSHQLRPLGNTPWPPWWWPSQRSMRRRLALLLSLGQAVVMKPCFTESWNDLCWKGP